MEIPQPLAASSEVADLLVVDVGSIRIHALFVQIGGREVAAQPGDKFSAPFVSVAM